MLKPDAKNLHIGRRSMHAIEGDLKPAVRPSVLASGMEDSMDADESGGVHRFGGDWTSRKLQVLADYLAFYTVALKKQNFEKIYIDAFAGTGYRKPRQPPAVATESEDSLFPDLAKNEPQKLLEGSARLALDVVPQFDRYIFIERSSRRCEQLEKLRMSLPALRGRIDIRRGDANEEIQLLCNEAGWATRRAVLFLDPYGMQVDWATIEAVARTEAIDMWLLFPLGMGVNRMLPRSGKMSRSWRERLNKLFGHERWYDDFYEPDTAPTLFDVDRRPVKASMETIALYFNLQLKRLFPGVAESPAILCNSSKSPLYVFCFAAANERGSKLALKIANHLLKGIR